MTDLETIERQYKEIEGLKRHCELLEGVIQGAINAIEGGEEIDGGFKQQFGVAFVKMLKGSLAGKYRDTAMDLLKKQIERQKDLITRKDEQFGVARDKNEVLVQGLESIINECTLGQVDWRSTIARIAKEAINPDG